MTHPTSNKNIVPLWNRDEPTSDLAERDAFLRGGSAVTLPAGTSILIGMIVPTETLDVSGEGLYQHKVGDETCRKGWCHGGVNGWPKRCECGGLIHADFGDENWDGDYWLHTKCDQCGDSAHDA